MSEQLAPPVTRVPSAADEAAILRIEQRSRAMLTARMEARQAHEQQRSLATVGRLRLRAALSDSDIESAEGFCALMRTAWGAWLLLPWDTFAAEPLKFRVLAASAPEWVWGILVLMGGLFSLGVLLTTNTTTRRLGAIFIGVVTWGGLAGLLVWANPVSTTSVIYPMMAGLSIWAFLRLSIGRGGRWAA